MSRNDASKRNLSSSSPSPKPNNKKNKLFITLNKYDALLENIGSLPEVFTPPLVTQLPSDLKEDTNETFN